MGFAEYTDRLETLKARDRYRTLAAESGHDFASNDYLGLANSDILRQAAHAALERGVGLGAGASRLLRGNDPEHEALEQEAAAFFGSEKALFFGTGFAANTALFSTLPRQGDLVVYDALIHASAHDGMRLGRAECQPFAHNDITDAESVIRNWRDQGGTGRIWLAFEAIYSMDGDVASIEDLITIAHQYDAVLVADEAHATGVLGDQGRGLLHAYEGQADIVTLHTCGKALGASGALVCGAAPLIDTLINKARGFIFSTAPSPLSAALVRASINALQCENAPSARLAKQVSYAHTIAFQKCAVPTLRSQIVPVIIGGDKTTMATAARMQARGFDVRGIRPPTVPRGTARLRISITLNVSEQHIHDMFSTLSQELDEQSDA